MPEAMAIAVDERTASFLLLGPATSIHRVVSNATAEEFQPGNWLINLEFDDEGVMRANEQFASCFEVEPECPLQQLAIIANGELISAPTVQTIDAADGIVVLGDFDEIAATEIADDLNFAFPVEFKLETGG